MLKAIISSSALSLSLVSFAQAGAPMAFDVAEDHTRIFMADNPLHENGMPAHGNAFVSQGYIYPAGTLDAGTKGVLEDGTPAFPDLVMGTWTCDGYFVGEGANATTGVWVISRQTFAFEDGDTIITQGTEIVDVGVENLRPVTGATGEYADLSGGMVQTLLGFSELMSVNVSFRMEQHASDHSYVAPKDASFDQTHHLEWDSGFPVGPIIDQSTVPTT